jgi:hypothetical protein
MTATVFDTIQPTYAEELRRRISAMLTVITSQKGYPLVECSRCGTVMITQVDGNEPENDAMECCSRCIIAMFVPEMAERL